MKRGELPDCARRALKQSGLVTIADPLATCGECPLGEKCYGSGAATIRLEHSGKVYGIVSVTAPADLVADEEERSLFREVVGDIAFALHNMELDEARKQAERAVEEAREYAEGIVETVREPLVVLDAELRVISANPSFYRTFKVAPEESEGRLIYELDNRQWDIARLRELLEQILPQNTRFYDFEVEHDFPAIGRRTMLLNARRIYREDNKTQMILLAIEDITERKQAEARVEHLNLVLKAIRGVNQLIVTEKERDRLLKGACDNLIKTRGYHSVWLALLDESGKLVTHAEAGLGKSFLPVLEQLKLGELVTCGRQALRQAGVVVTEDPASTCADCPLAKEYGGRGALTARLEYGGKVYGVLSISVPADLVADEEERSLFKEVVADIAFALHNIELEEKRKLVEKALQESEQRYRTLVESITDIVFTLDREGKFTYLGPTFQDATGYSVQSLIGHSFTEIIAPEYIESTVDRFRKGVSGEKIPLYEIELLLKDGERLPVELNVTSLLDAEGQAIGRLGVARDITQRKQSEKKAREVETLKEIDRMRSGLLANVSHELRTPLASIKGFTSTLLRTDVKWSEEEQRDFLETIDHESNRLIRLINDLLDMSRIDAGGLKLAKRSYQITEILDSISNGLAILTEHHRLQTIVPPDLPSVFVDEMRIGQVLTNLVENAVKFSAEGTQITIEAQPDDDQVNIIVTDEGIGIPIESQSKLFDRFYQAESIVTGRKHGTGLGLSICKGIIEAHGGRIWVASKMGEGAKFGFTLPVGKGEEEIAKDSGY